MRRLSHMRKIALASLSFLCLFSFYETRLLAAVRVKHLLTLKTFKEGYRRSKFNAYYINLPSREDRRLNVETQLERLGVYVTRVEAVDVRLNETELAGCSGDERNMKTCAGKIGCKLSHLKALKLAMSARAKYVAIFEDDFEWTTEIDPTTVVREIVDFEKLFPSWNVIGLSMRVKKFTDVRKNISLGPKAEGKILRIKAAVKSHAYVVRYDYLPRLIANFEACDVKSHYEGAIDRCWKSLQETDEWYGFFRQLGTQTASYSDIEQKNVNSSALILNPPGVLPKRLWEA